jgi:hypothetical protein
MMKWIILVKRKDEKQYGDYRTKRAILEIYDEMKRAMETGEPYQTRLYPPPADPKVAHPPERQYRHSQKRIAFFPTPTLHNPQSACRTDPDPA